MSTFNHSDTMPTRIETGKTYNGTTEGQTYHVLSVGETHVFFRPSWGKEASITLETFRTWITVESPAYKEGYEAGYLAAREPKRFDLALLSSIALAIGFFIGHWL